MPCVVLSFAVIFYRSNMSAESSGIHHWNARAIADFFGVLVPEVVDERQRGGVTEAACTQLGKEILNAQDVRPVNIQGTSSFTLISPSTGRIVQFRQMPLNDTMLAIAETVYGALTPNVVHYTGDVEFPLPIYITNVIRGIHLTHFLPPPVDEPFILNKRLRTVTDLADFIAKAVRHPQPESACCVDGWTSSASSHLDRLLTHQPFIDHAPGLIPIVAEARQHVHLLDKLPLVLTHVDLSPPNIFVDADSAIVGVIDWDGARVEAFGMCIWTFYEYFSSSRFNDSPYARLIDDGTSVRDLLRNAFWDRLWSRVSDVLQAESSGPALRTSVMVGAVYRYLDIDVLEDIVACNGENLDRAKTFLPVMPRIIDSTDV